MDQFLAKHFEYEANDDLEGVRSTLAEAKVTNRWRRHGENFLVDESVWSGIAAGRPFGLEGRGRPIEFRFLHVIDFTDDGQMAREQVWVDLAALQQQLPQD